MRLHRDPSSSTAGPRRFLMPPPPPLSSLVSSFIASAVTAVTGIAPQTPLTRLSSALINGSGMLL
uniref:Uncharacterized protein n=1 Tax=Arundo donax TaxID=35708 RepID=A0A0A9ESX5_ARUDO